MMGLQVINPSLSFLLFLFFFLTISSTFIQTFAFSQFCRGSTLVAETSGSIEVLREMMESLALTMEMMYVENEMESSILV